MACELQRHYPLLLPYLLTLKHEITPMFAGDTVTYFGMLGTCLGWNSVSNYVAL